MPEEPDPPQPPPEDATIMMTPPMDGRPILPPSSAPLREVIGDFEIVAKIGQGGMGAVYRARQVSLDRQIALKLLPAQMGGDEDAVARFRREARVASSLSHANLVAVYAAGEADGCHFIAMELIEGEDLGRRLKRDGRPTVPEALRICAEVTRGLDHGWRSAQLIHRDIKPANIFLAADGAVKLGDLGLAKTLGSLTTGLTQSGTMLGTPHYMSPEQARGDRELDFRADIYSLGCTLYQMLTGQVPYRGGDAITIIRQHLDAPLPAIMKVWPQCPVPLARLVGRMLKKSRHERPASYAELLGQIDSVWAQIDPVGHSPEAFAPPPRHVEPEVTAPLLSTPPTGTSRPASKSKALLYGGLAAGVLVLAAVAFAFWPRPEPLTKAQIIAAQRAVAKASAPDGDKAPPFHSTLSTATKDAPFVNSLGMKFVPVPITGGPTGGQRVLFSIWETRVQDYATFTKDTKREWAKAFFSMEPMLPAMDVSWEDAQDFCAWLTERDRKADKLGTDERYRLPSDHEWSCAVGIGEREDAAKTPQEKDMKIQDAFPWGSAWPPPEQAGNYAGEELQPALAAGKYPWIKGVLTGYRDRYIESAPAGSFPANRFGLFDLGGNVSEWCEDWYNAQQNDRVLRGESWNSNNRDLLLAAKRGLYVPTTRYGSLGFRVVVAAASSGPSATDGKSPVPKAAASASIAELLTSPDYEWSKPENLGPNVNSPQDEYRLALSDDGLILVFNSQRTAEPGLYESRRPSVDEPFGPAVPIAALNSVGKDCGGPSLSGDGLTLLYTSQAGPNQRGGDDIYQARRRTRSSPWEPPVNLGPPVNTIGRGESDPCLSPDGLTLLFSADRPGGEGGLDLWRTRRKSPNAPFENPENLGRGMNSELLELGPRFTADPRTILFSREDGKGTPGKIFVAVEDTSGQWTARPLDLPVKRGVQRPALSPDGRTLYFTSWLPGGQGGADLWQIRRVPKAGPATPAAAWKPVVLTKEDVDKQPGASLSPSGEFTTSQWFALPRIFGSDLAIRGEVRVASGNANNSISLRYGGGGTDTRFLAIYSRAANLQLMQQKEVNDQYPVLSSIKYPPGMEVVDKWVPFEFAVVGKQSFATVQSLALAAATSEKAVQPGGVQFHGHMYLRKLEVVILDGVPEAQWPEFIRTALKQSAAK